MILEKETVQKFRENGAAALPGAFADWVDKLRAGVAWNMESPSSDVRIYYGEKKTDGSGKFFGDYCNWQRIPEYEKFIFNSPAAKLASQLMGAETVQLFHEHVFVKEAMANVGTPWHQDMPYYCIDVERSVSFWIPLDDVPRERTLEFVAGSHLWGKHFRPDRFNGQPLNQNDGMETIPDIDADRSSYDILGWALKAGDAVAFDFRTVHGAPANKSTSSARRAFALRLVGDGAVFNRLPGRVSSPPFPDVVLDNGASLDGEQFPLLLSAKKP